MKVNTIEVVGDLNRLIGILLKANVLRSPQHKPLKFYTKALAKHLSENSAAKLLARFYAQLVELGDIIAD